MVLCAGGCVRAGDGSKNGRQRTNKDKKWWLDRFEHLWQYYLDVDGMDTVATPNLFPRTMFGRKRVLVFVQ